MSRDTVILLGGSTLTVALLINNVANGGGAAVLRLGVRPHRAREHDGDRVRPRRRRATGCWARRARARGPSYLQLGLIFFTWGEIFSLFPSTCTDTFGTKYATVNASFLYTAKGLSAFLVPLANVLKAATGSWHAVFVTTAVMNFAVVLLAIFVLRPLRHSIGAPQPLHGHAGE